MTETPAASSKSSKRPRSPAGEDTVTSPVEGNGREVKVVTVTDFAKIVKGLAGRNLFKPEEAEIIIKAFQASQDSENLTNNDTADLRKKMVRCANKASTAQDEDDVETCCLVMKFLARDLPAAALKADKPATFDALWKAASSVFSASFDYLIATRFILLEDFTATEATKPFELNMVKPAPIRLLLDGRCTKVHVIGGERGVGKTVTLMSGACGPDTYSRTLGVYMKAPKFVEFPVDENDLRPLEKKDERNRRTSIHRKASKFTVEPEEPPIDEMHLLSLKTDERNRCASQFVVGRVKRAMEDFLKAGNFSPIAPGALKDRGLVVCIDELVSRPVLVRAIIWSYATITSEITKDLYFSKVVIMLAGTGIEGTTLALGSGSDAKLYEIHTLPANRK